MTRSNAVEKGVFVTNGTFGLEWFEKRAISAYWIDYEPSLGGLITRVIYALRSREDIIRYKSCLENITSTALGAKASFRVLSDQKILQALEKIKEYSDQRSPVILDGTSGYEHRSHPTDRQSARFSDDDTLVRKSVSDKMTKSKRIWPLNGKEYPTWIIYLNWILLSTLVLMLGVAVPTVISDMLKNKQYYEKNKEKIEAEKLRDYIACTELRDANKRNEERFGINPNALRASDIDCYSAYE